MSAFALPYRVASSAAGMVLDWYDPARQYILHRRKQLENSRENFLQAEVPIRKRRTIETTYVEQSEVKQRMNQHPTQQSPSDEVRNNLVYSELPLAHIRLLRVDQRPTSQNNRLSFTLLMKRKVEVQHEYCAVSYCWGSARKTHEIDINGEVFMVGTTLFDLLFKLANQMGPGFLLWVDAICINQNDHPERSREVLKMKQIYNGAASVKAWLGPRHEDAEILLDFINRVRSSTASTSLQADLFSTIRRQWDAFGFHLEKRDKLEKAIRHVLCNPYWSRVWVIQEFSVHDELRVLWGDIELDIRALTIYAAMVRVIPFKYKSSSDITMQVHHLSSLLSTRAVCQEKGDCSLLTLLERSRHAQCTEKRDQVFGVLSLASDGLNYIPEPDYETSFERLRVAMTKRWIGDHKSLEIICNGPRDDTPLSWCPDFFNVLRSPMHDEFGLSVPQPTVNTKPSYSIVGDPPTKLKTLSWPLGSIKSLGWILDDGDSGLYPATILPPSSAGHSSSLGSGSRIHLQRILFLNLYANAQWEGNPKKGQYSNKLAAASTACQVKKDDPTAFNKLHSLLMMKTAKRVVDMWAQENKRLLMETPTGTSFPKVLSSASERKLEEFYQQKLHEQHELLARLYDSMADVHARLLASCFEKSEPPSDIPLSTPTRYHHWFSANARFRTESCKPDSSSSSSSFEAALENLSKTEIQWAIQTHLQPHPTDEITSLIFKTLRHAIDSRWRLMLLNQGEEFELGWARPDAKLNDVVYHVKGCPKPLILREEQGKAEGSHTTYRIVGPAIVNGFEDPDRGYWDEIVII